MGDHVVLCVDGHVKPRSLHSLQGVEVAPGSSGEGTGLQPPDAPTCAIDVDGVGERGVSEEEALIQSVECRICQEEDSIKNLEIPCACNGSLKVFLKPWSSFKI